MCSQKRLKRHGSQPSGDDPSARLGLGLGNYLSSGTANAPSHYVPRISFRPSMTLATSVGGMRPTRLPIRSTDRMRV
jgi:hypothetical protein